MHLNFSLEFQCGTFDAVNEKERLNCRFWIDLLEQFFIHSHLYVGSWLTVKIVSIWYRHLVHIPCAPDIAFISFANWDWISHLATVKWEKKRIFHLHQKNWVQMEILKEQSWSRNWNQFICGSEKNQLNIVKWMLYSTSWHLISRMNVYDLKNALHFAS